DAYYQLDPKPSAGVPKFLGFQAHPGGEWTMMIGTPPPNGKWAVWSCPIVYYACYDNRTLTKVTTTSTIYFGSGVNSGVNPNQGQVGWCFLNFSRYLSAVSVVQTFAQTDQEYFWKKAPLTAWGGPVFNPKW